MNKLYEGWQRAEDMSGWRYYPEPTYLRDEFTIRIYEDYLPAGKWSLDTFDAPTLNDPTIEDMVIPDHLRDPAELLPWALSIWRMS